MAKATKKAQYADFTKLISQKEKALTLKEMRLDKGVTAINILKREIEALKKEIRELKAK